MATVLPGLLDSVQGWSSEMTNVRDHAPLMSHKKYSLTRMSAQMRLEKRAAEDALAKMTLAVRSRLDVKSRRSASALGPIAKGLALTLLFLKVTFQMTSWKR